MPHDADGLHFCSKIRKKKMTMTLVNSSAIRAVGCDGHTLTVVFHSGCAYDHPNVPYSVYLEFMNASSLGAYYHQHLRGRYR
jgi:KTSC domain